MAGADNSNLASAIPVNSKMTRSILHKFLGGLLVVLTSAAAMAQSAHSLGSLPLYFAEQAPENGVPVFQARSRDCQVSITPAKVQLNLRNQAAIQARLLGASPMAQIRGEAELTGKVNYLTGSDPAQWRTGIPMFARVRLDHIYPGISAVFYGNKDRMEYDFTVSPGSDPAAIRLRFSGADKIAINARGDLDLFAGSGRIQQPKPVIYQTIAGARHEIAGDYWLLDDQTVAFAIGNYDRKLPLVIDPILIYSSYFGGNANDAGTAVALNPTDGSIFMAGQTTSPKASPTGGPFSTTNAYQRTYGGGTPQLRLYYGDAFVAKFDSNFNLVYLTYLGGSGDDAATAIAVDAAGFAFVAGSTDSTNFPVYNINPNLTGVPGVTSHLSGSPLQGVGTPPLDGFITELSPDGSHLIYSTYFGGNAEDRILGLAIDSADNAYVTGYTLSTNLPATNAIPFQLLGMATNLHYLNYLACTYSYFNENAFVAKIAAQGAGLGFCSYLGGTNFDTGTAIAVDSANNVYVAGYTSSTNFPLTNAFKYVLNGNTNLYSTPYYNLFDAFVTKLAPTPTNYNLVYSTLLGSTNTDQAFGIAVDDSGAYVAGLTSSSNFVNTTHNLIGAGVTNNGFGFGFATNVFLTKITNDPNAVDHHARIAYSVVWGGFLNDAGFAVAVDPFGNAFVTGSTASPTFPTANAYGLLHTNLAGQADAFVTAFNADCSKVLYSAYLGGNYNDAGIGIAVDQNSTAYVVGQTYSLNFPVTRAIPGTPIYSAASTNIDGITDGFLAAIQLGGLDLGPTLSITKTKTNYVTVTWPYYPQLEPHSPALQLQFATNPVGKWFQVTNRLILTTNLHLVALPSTNPPQFFRLYNTNNSY